MTNDKKSTQLIPYIKTLPNYLVMQTLKLPNWIRGYRLDGSQKSDFEYYNRIAPVNFKNAIIPSNVKKHAPEKPFEFTSESFNSRLNAVFFGIRDAFKDIQNKPPKFIVQTSYIGTASLLSAIYGYCKYNLLATPAFAVGGYVLSHLTTLLDLTLTRCEEMDKIEQKTTHFINDIYIESKHSKNLHQFIENVNDYIKVDFKRRLPNITFRINKAQTIIEKLNCLDANAQKQLSANIDYKNILNGFIADPDSQYYVTHKNCSQYLREVEAEIEKLTPTSNITPETVYEKPKDPTLQTLQQ